MVEPLGTLSELRAELDDGGATSRGLVERALERAGEVGERLGVFRHLRGEAALAEADAADARRAAGETRGPLDGIPVVVKDNFSQQGEPTGCASKILEGYVSPYDAGAVEGLGRAGAIIVGRTNMDEFAMGSSNENSAYGPVRNPWDGERVPGGSSGGSAVAVAAGIVPVAFGSDTGGSIRQPASHCGVVGMKPTYGRVSRYGLVAFASSLDQIGPLAHSAADAAVALAAVAGHDPRDSTSLPEPVPDYAAGLDGDVSGLTIGLPREYFVEEGVDPDVLARVREGVEVLQAAGAKVREVTLPHTEHAIAAYYLIATAEASSNLARFDGVRYGHRAEGATQLRELYERSRSEGFGAEVKRRILLGTYVLSSGYYDAYYKKALQVRTLLRRDFEAAFRECDVLATPTTPAPAFKLGENTRDPLRMYMADVYTVAAPIAGIPGISVPCGFAHGLPVGLQLLGPPLGEGTLLRAADAYQRETQHHEARPPEGGA
ncbi:MAG: Asp-tRNA(Asn)/Glu-tRNA(Gln) amidotransferase subunit GatA [Deltaproteobacteria bacterium]|nr:Asp-tRNA(Asn)/Glu-tRNA(Gln) amidotransferase subunit GatA [Deltaproteobacteria bacterium]